MLDYSVFPKKQHLWTLVKGKTVGLMYSSLYFNLVYNIKDVAGSWD